MRTVPTLVVVSILGVSIHAQSVGPDVTVSSLTDVLAYGQANNITAFAVGTVACNVGTVPVMWTSSNNQHPVIAQNMYRYANGRFEQIGMSWLKHGFVSTNSPGCGSCQQPPLGGGQLGVGCTDAYGASLNGGSSLGPRSEVNASTGFFLIPHGTSTGHSTIKGRVQVPNADLANASALYFVEAEYVTADDALAGNKNNNATWQRIVVPAVGATGNVAFVGAVHPQQPALYAWQAQDASVAITTFDIANDGRFFIGKKVTALGGGNHHYEFAIYNMSSDRSGGQFSVVFPAGTSITNGAFRSIPYHSGEPYVNTPWNILVNSNTIDFTCEAYLSNVNANALRWGTMHNYSFDATAAAEISKTILPFKPLAPCTTQFTSPLGPGSIQMVHTVCPAAVSKDWFVAFTQNQGVYPNGWLYGVDIPFQEVAAEFAQGYPYTGTFDASGAGSFGPMTGLPSGLTFYTVTLHCAPGFGSVLSIRPKQVYTIP